MTTKNKLPPMLSDAKVMVAVLWILAERDRQKARWTADHDDEHTDQDWQLIIARLATEEGVTHQDRMVRIASTAMAALEAYVRFQQSMRTPMQGGE